MRELISKEDLAKSDSGTYELPESEIIDGQYELAAEIAMAYTKLSQENPEYKFVLLVNPLNNRVIFKWSKRHWDLFR